MSLNQVKLRRTRLFRNWWTKLQGWESNLKTSEPSLESLKTTMKSFWMVDLIKMLRFKRLMRSKKRRIQSTIQLSLLKLKRRILRSKLIEKWSIKRERPWLLNLKIWIKKKLSLKNKYRSSKIMLMKITNQSRSLLKSR